MSRIKYSMQPSLHICDTKTLQIHQLQICIINQDSNVWYLALLDELWCAYHGYFQIQLKRNSHNKRNIHTIVPLANEATPNGILKLFKSCRLDLSDGNEVNSLNYILVNTWNCVSSTYLVFLLWSWEYVIYIITIIKSDVWIIFHCLGLGYEPIRAVCLTMFLWVNTPHILTRTDNISRTKLSAKTCAYRIWCNVGIEHIYAILGCLAIIFERKELLKKYVRIGRQHT